MLPNKYQSLFHPLYSTPKRYFLVWNKKNRKSLVIVTMLQLHIVLSLRRSRKRRKTHIFFIFVMRNEMKLTRRSTPLVFSATPGGFEKASSQKISAKAEIHMPSAVTKQHFSFRTSIYNVKLYSCMQL